MSLQRLHQTSFTSKDTIIKFFYLNCYEIVTIWEEEKTITLNPERQLQVLNLDYVSKSEIRDLYGWSKARCRKEFDEVKKEMIDEGKRLMGGYPERIPLDRLTSKYPMTYSKLLREVKRKAAELTTANWILCKEFKQIIQERCKLWKEEELIGGM